jgi:hypothetical protein
MANRLYGIKIHIMRKYFLLAIAHVSSGGWTKGPLEAQFHRDIVSPHHNSNNNTSYSVCPYPEVFFEKSVLKY